MVGGVAKRSRRPKDGSGHRAMPGRSKQPSPRPRSRGTSGKPAHVEGKMAGSELRAELEQRLGALAIRTEVVEHPEVRLWPQEGRSSGECLLGPSRGL